MGTSLEKLDYPLNQRVGCEGILPPGVDRPRVGSNVFDLGGPFVLHGHRPVSQPLESLFDFCEGFGGPALIRNGIVSRIGGDDQNVRAECRHRLGLAQMHAEPEHRPFLKRVKARPSVSRPGPGATSRYDAWRLPVPLPERLPPPWRPEDP